MQTVNAHEQYVLHCAPGKHGRGLQNEGNEAGRKRRSC
jgi:hypothetical protein